jgi:hypothetical protein
MDRAICEAAAASLPCGPVSLGGNPDLDRVAAEAAADKEMRLLAKSELLGDLPLDCNSRYSGKLNQQVDASLPQ